MDGGPRHRWGSLQTSRRWLASLSLSMHVVCLAVHASKVRSMHLHEEKMREREGLKKARLTTSERIHLTRKLFMVDMKHFSGIKYYMYLHYLCFAFPFCLRHNLIEQQWWKTINVICYRTQYSWLISAKLPSVKWNRATQRDALFPPFFIARLFPPLLSSAIAQTSFVPKLSILHYFSIGSET